MIVRGIINTLVIKLPINTPRKPLGPIRDGKDRRTEIGHIRKCANQDWIALVLMS